MAFGEITTGADGKLYDSQAEERVSRILQDLEREKVISAYVAHPLLSGIEFDFMVQVGDAPTQHPSGESQKRKMILIEYDGLAEARQEDLALKTERHTNIRLVGIEVRFLLATDYQSVRACIQNYTPPHFVTKTMLCACGTQKRVLVIAKKPENQTLTEIEGTFTCRTCGGR